METSKIEQFNTQLYHLFQKVQLNQLSLKVPITLPLNSTLLQVMAKMQKFECSSILLTEKDKLVGIVTDRDILTKVTNPHLNPDTVELSSIMTYSPLSIQGSATLSEAIKLMTEHACRHLPIVDHHKKLTAIVSMTDLMNFLSQQIDLDQCNQD